MSRYQKMNLDRREAGSLQTGSPGPVGAGLWLVSSSRKARLLPDAPLLALLLAMLAVSAAIAPDGSARLPFLDLRYPALPGCLILEHTGLPCLFCGMTRSFMAMGGLDLGSAFSFHPLGPVFFGLAAWAGLYLAFSLATGKRLAVRARGRVWLTAAGMVTAMVLLAWPLKLWLWRRTGLM